MTISLAFTLFITLLVLAVIPGPGIMVVVARTLSQGYKAGLVTSVGIVAGDFIFIGLTIFGLATLSQSLGDFFLIIKYAGAAYLIWLGLNLFLENKSIDTDDIPEKSRYATNFIAGLLTTLSNPKAILFYASFFPAFIDVSVVNYIDIAVILLITTFSVGGVMILYVYLTYFTGSSLKSLPIFKKVKYGSGALLVGSGAYVAIRA